MYVHLGRDYVLNDRDIIGIFNLETTTELNRVCILLFSLLFLT